MKKSRIFRQISGRLHLDVNISDSEKKSKYLDVSFHISKTIYIYIYLDDLCFRFRNYSESEKNLDII